MRATSALYPPSSIARQTWPVLQLKSGMFDRNEEEDCLANFTVVWSDMFSGSLSFPPA